jgi:hypothetical protein
MDFDQCSCFGKVSEPAAAPQNSLAPGREYKLLAQNDLGETVMAAPAISDGVLYIRGRKHLFAVGSKK